MQELDFKKFKEMEDEKKSMSSNRRLINEALVVGGAVGVASTFIATSPASAAEGGIADVTAMITAVQGVASAGVAVLVLAMGVRLAAKQVNRILTKG